MKPTWYYWNAPLDYQETFKLANGGELTLRSPLGNHQLEGLELADGRRIKLESAPKTLKLGDKFYIDGGEYMLAKTHSGPNFAIGLISLTDGNLWSSTANLASPSCIGEYDFKRIIGGSNLDEVYKTKH